MLNTLDPKFKVIEGGDLPDLSDDEIRDLSTDQKYLYRILQVIRTGIIPPNFEKYNMGPLNHARWLTLANRICRLYISQVRLSSKLKSDLFQVAQFILLCYGPGNQAMQSQRKKKQRDNEEKKKESSRIAKFREENKSDKTVTKKKPNEKQKS